MIHEMKLNEKPFNNINNGVKKIELRLTNKNLVKSNYMRKEQKYS